MDLKKIVMDIRLERNLHGRFPVVVSIPPNPGNIVPFRNGYYVLTLTKDNCLYFHGLSKFRKKYDPNKDFKIMLDPFKNYTYRILTKTVKEVCLINDNEFLPFRFFAGLPTSYEGEYNVSYLCEEFEKRGIIERNIIIPQKKDDEKNEEGK